MAKIESFERHSDAYDDWFDRHCDLYEAELTAVRRMLPSAEADCLEVGVGSGKFAGPLGIRIGVDPSPSMALKAREVGVDVLLGVAEDLPIADARFDWVLMVTTICFVDDVDRSLREVSRVLRPHGCIVVGFVDRESSLGRSYEAKRERSRFYKDATFFSVQEVVSHLARARFRTASMVQALIPGTSPGVIAEGTGEGAFVVIKGVREPA